MPDSAAPLTRRAFLRMVAGDPPSGPAHREALPDADLLYDLPVVQHAGRFFRQSYRPGQGAPAVDLQRWTLAVGGLVERPLMLAYDELRALPAVGETRALLCLGNPPGGEHIGNAVWRGCQLDDLLARAGVQPGATHLAFAAADGYTTSLPLGRVVGQNVLMAYEMNGARLPREHGFPLRALVPGLYGTKSPKWLTRLTLTSEAQPGTWEQRGWSDDPVIKTRAQIVTPRPQDVLIAGQAVHIQGVAFAGTRAITAVEVSIDGGDWMPATLRPPDAPRAWTQWYARWTPAWPGVQTISVRATDETGFTQTRAPALRGEVFPAGSDAIHSLAVQVVTG